MKIYIPNINPKNIKEKHFNIGNSMQKIKYELFSKEQGYFRISDNEVLYLEPNMNQNYELIQNYKGLDLLIDKTKEEYIKVTSQLPVNYVCTKLIEYKYKGTYFNLIVECLDESTILEKNIVPINFYLEYVNDKEKIDFNNKFLDVELNTILFKLK
jgi:hypothetical protein